FSGARLAEEEQGEPGSGDVRKRRKIARERRQERGKPCVRVRQGARIEVGRRLRRGCDRLAVKEDRPPELDDVSVGKGGSRDPRAVDEGAVGGVAILERPA